MENFHYPFLHKAAHRRRRRLTFHLIHNVRNNNAFFRALSFNRNFPSHRPYILCTSSDAGEQIHIYLGHDVFFYHNVNPSYTVSTIMTTQTLRVTYYGERKLKKKKVYLYGDMRFLCMTFVSARKSCHGQSTVYTNGSCRWLKNVSRTKMTLADNLSST